MTTARFDLFSFDRFSSLARQGRSRRWQSVWSAALLGTAVALLAMGCDDGTDPDAGTVVDDDDAPRDPPPLPDAPYTQENGCTTVAIAHCQYLFQCCNQMERVRLSGSFIALGDFRSEGECVYSLKDLCETSGGLGLSSGERVRWDAEIFQTCAEPLVEAATRCDPEPFWFGGEYQMLGLDNRTEACSRAEFIEGTVEEGDVCYAGYECANERAVCVPVDPTNDGGDVVVSLKGTCKVLAIGDPCTFGAGETGGCPEGTWCVYDEDAGDNLCTVRPGVGDACDYQGECPDGTFCNVFGEQVCTEPFEDGASCVDDLQCGSHCDADVCSAPRPNGDACSRDAQCAGYCNDDNLCAALLADGEDCDDDAVCQSGRCDYLDSVCVDPDAEVTYVYDVCTGND